MPPWLDSLPPLLVWGLYTRALALVLFISFVSLAGQIVRGAGRDGGLPIHRRLRKISEDFPTWRRFYYFPTLLWLSDSDAMLRLLTWAGAGAAVVAFYGGPWSPWAFGTCYLCYLSLDMAAGLIFPWDCALFESLVLALFLPGTNSLPNIDALATPPPALAWAFRLIVFRVMFGFGKQKFMGSGPKDLAYLKGFLIAQPLPSPLGWYHQKLPAFLLKGLVLFMFFAEIPAPLFVFVPGVLSIVCAAVTVFLMIGIQAMGSFGYFSMLTMGACIPLLDNVTPRQLDLLHLFSAGQPIFTNLFVLLHTTGASFAFLFNSWVGQSYTLWSTWWRLPRLAQLPLDFLRFMHPFRWLHPYGVFPPNTSPGVKISMLVEVTWDGETWHEVPFNYSPSNPKSAPKFIAPYHPRGDQAVIYETFGLNPTSLISSMVGPWDPYSYGSQPAANVLLQCILEGRGADFMQGDVLRAHEDPPKQARISTIMLEPCSLKEHLETGNWWKRSYIGPHAPPREKIPLFWEHSWPEPEMWHYDAIFWRKRSKLGKLMDRSRAGNEDPMALAIADSKGLSAEDAEKFWNELIPMVPSSVRETFDTLPDVVPAVRAKFDREQLWRFHRLLGRFSLLLVARLEPMYLGRGLHPEIPAKTYFHLWMLVQHVIANGREAYLAAMANPKSLAAELEHLKPESGLYLLSIFRYESMVFEAQKLRLITAFSPPHDEEQKQKVLHSTEHMSDFEKTIAKLASAFSGFFAVMPLIRDNFKGPRFDHGYPELYPSFQQLDSGEVVVRAKKSPPPGVTLPATNAAE
ncbi:MAG TPA: lipase maturation factor family protein [Polyangiaceae bacterium]|nr:lipase maturation factor family protein [Polyangiaceae bacterium]